MKPYRELVREYPELGEILAELQLEIEELQNLQPYHKEQDEIKPIYQDMEWTPRQWGAIEQLKAQVLYLDNKVKELQSSKRKKRQPPKNILVTNNK